MSSSYDYLALTTKGDQQNYRLYLSNDQTRLDSQTVRTLSNKERYDTATIIKALMNTKDIDFSLTTNYSNRKFYIKDGSAALEKDNAPSTEINILIGQELQKILDLATK